MFDSSFYDAGEALVKKYRDQLSFCDQSLVTSLLAFLGDASPLQRGAYFFVVNHFTDISKMINAMHACALLGHEPQRAYHC